MFQGNFLLKKRGDDPTVSTAVMGQDALNRKETGIQQKKCQFFELMLEVISRMVAAISGRVFISSSTFRMDERTVA